MIELGQFGGYHYRVSSPGHVNAKGQPDDFAVYCDTLAQARGVEATRAHVAASPSPVAASLSGRWKGPPTSWLLGSTKYADRTRDPHDGSNKRSMTDESPEAAKALRRRPRAGGGDQRGS
jgi:hypothetical protein